MTVWVSLVFLFVGLGVIAYTRSVDGFKAGILIIAIGGGMSILMGTILEAAKHPERVDYGIPHCPEDGLRHYETSLSWKDDEVVRSQFQDKGWANLTVFSRADGGIFGGRTDYMSGDCEVA